MPLSHHLTATTFHTQTQSITFMSCHLCHAYVSHSPSSPSSLPPCGLIIPDVTSPYHPHPSTTTVHIPFPISQYPSMFIHHFPVTNTSPPLKSGHDYRHYHHASCIVTWNIIYKVLCVIFKFI